MAKTIYIKYLYTTKETDVQEERYAFIDINILNAKSLIKVIEEIKKEKGYVNLFIEEIKVLGTVEVQGR